MTQDFDPPVLPVRASAAEAASLSDVTEEHAITLARTMQDRGVHPVLVFGTAASGKSSMLQSLLHYGVNSSDPALGLRLGANVVPPSFPDFEARYQDAKEFFHGSVPQFGNGRVVGRTQKHFPYFIPVDMVAPHDGLPLRLAFLEGNGEWYEKEGASNADFKEFKPEVTALLTRFTDAISVIFVAPCAIDGRQETLRYSHECLRNSMNEYQAKRIEKSGDNVLLLAAKWDARCAPDDGRGYFDSAPVAVLLEELKKTGFSWPAFKAIKGVRGKMLMPYSAGWIEKEIVNDPGRHAATFDRFNRTLWNWLYGNIREAADAPSLGRQILYADAVQRKPPGRLRLDTVMAALLWSWE